MAVNPGQTILLVGVLGAGGYLAYEYYQYSHAINSLANGNQSVISSAENVLSFFQYLSANWSGTGGMSAAQVQIYQAIQAFLSGATTQTQTPAPGTTSSNQPTNIGTTSGSTTSGSTSSTSPTTIPTPSIATAMANAIGMQTANADQWNYAYNQLMGQGADAQYKFNFDKVYGPVVNGVRWSGTMSAQVFLQMAQNGAGMSGLGTIVRLAGPALTTQGNLIYQAHHPFPYVPTYTLRGLGAMGAMVQASGFEKALFTRQPMRSNRLL